MNPVCHRALIINEAGSIQYRDVLDELDMFRELIGCEVIDIRLWWIGSHRFGFVIDDDGRLKKRKPTVFGPNADPVFVGTVLVFGLKASEDGTDFCSLTEQEEKLLENCMATFAIDDRTVLTNVTQREFAPWTLEGSE